MTGAAQTTVFPFPVAVQNGTGMVRAPVGGTAETLSAAQGLLYLAREPHLVCHAPYLVERLRLIAGADRRSARSAGEIRHLDVAELFLFVVPASFAIPTPRGLARVLNVEAGDGPAAVLAVAQELLRRLCLADFPDRRETAEVANFLAHTNWPWAKPVLHALSGGNGQAEHHFVSTGLNIWDRIAEWDDPGPTPPGTHHGIGREAALAKLDQLLGDDAEERPGQRAYCAAAVQAFAPRQSPHENNILLAEAGTGLGKTLAYLAPAHLWSKRNGQPVWLSTYTKNLQRQLEQETARIFSDPAERRERIVIRKGRENYLCLLNMQEAFSRLTGRNATAALTAALIARWARYSRDGDMVGGDFPAWLMSLLAEGSPDNYRQPTPQALGLTDRRGECIYSSCPHYRRCFIERAERAARKADMVIANHALVLHRAAVDYGLGVGSEEEGESGQARRLVFDEGHHLFDAADSAFSGHLTGLETAELRRWIRGPEMRGRRGRSLADRLQDLVARDEAAEKLIEETAVAALALPGPGWQQRIQAGGSEGQGEIFLTLVRQQVLARADNGGGQTLETDCEPLISGLEQEASLLAAQLLELQRPMLRLAAHLAKKLDNEAAELDSAERARIEAVVRSLRRRGSLLLGSYVEMIERLDQPLPSLVSWFAIEQQWGREIDVGLHSHWIDPTEPLAETVLKRADGIIITSATLKDRPPESPEDWQSAEMRTGVAHLSYPVSRMSHDSPYDYCRNARIVIINDVNREDMDQVAAAYRELFLASSGGALGLFTAISRLRQVHGRLVEPLAQLGLTVYAQHIDPIDTGTLVDMFRAERDACLLGTDAVRDGVDVPGDSLRLIVLDRVPWPQPNILERARRQAFGGIAYQDMIVRLRLRQAFGRLIRGGGDRGVFVVLDARLASRFLTAFPDNTPISRCGLVEAIEQVGRFLGTCARH
jgi:ATP-dependent DNA helicase DinG